ncbi:MAG: nitroreductase family protein [Bacteroidales bacterium]|nr:nitroreductase family protein [Bacteroidales bacterium]
MLIQIEKRFSPLSFDSRPIDEITLKQLFNAASRAPSSFNEQPWRFYYSFKGQDSYEKLIKSMDPYNQVWASTAPVLVVVGAKKTFTHNNNPNSYARFDTGTAIGFLIIQAMENDIYSHMMAGFNPDQVRKDFQINEDIDIITILALGYLGDPYSLPKEYHERATNRRPRKPLDEFVTKI